MRGDKPAYMIYEDWSRLCAGLPVEVAGALFVAICQYQNGDDPTITDPVAAAIFEMMKPKMEEDTDNYKQKVEKSREASASRWAKSKAMQDDADGMRTDTERITDGMPEDANYNYNYNYKDNHNDKKLLKTKELKEKSAKADQKKAAASAYSDDPGLNEAIKDFVEHRKKLRKPMTDKAISLFIARLNGMAADTPGKVALINNAIEKGWQTVYPDKEPHQTREPPGQSTEDYLMSVINGEVTI